MLTSVARAVRVLVVDDHPVVREGVALLVDGHPGLEMAGYARTGAEAIEVAAAVGPDVVLLDLRLPDMLAPEVATALRVVAPGARIVVFTAHASHVALATLRAAGVDGCLLKDATRTDLVDAIRRAARGEAVFDPRIDGAPVDRARDTARGPGLTSREYDVLRRVAMGETNPEIAEALGLARNTVKAYLQSVLQKLGARNRVEAVARANEAGLL